MSAETLRRAAALMRERAEAATPGPWETGEHCIWNSVPQPSGIHLGQVIVSDGQAGDGGIAMEEDTEHIASWHPAVALAVADWLDDALEAHLGVRPGNYPSYLKAVTVARAYLGEAS